MFYLVTFKFLKHLLIFINFLFTGVSPDRVTKDDLTIPDSYCNPNVNRNASRDGITNGHKCPKGFVCMKLSEQGRQKLGFIGFGNFFTSVFSVYTGFWTHLFFKYIFWA